LLGKIISYRSAFAFRSSAPALAAGLPSQDHVYKITDESFRFHNKNFDEIRCKLDSTENPRSFEIYPTPPYAGRRTKFAPVKSLNTSEFSSELSDLETL